MRPDEAPRAQAALKNLNINLSSLTFILGPQFGPQVGPQTWDLRLASDGPQTDLSHGLNLSLSLPVLV